MNGFQWIVFSLAILINLQFVNAQNISIIDSENKSPLVGATIQIEQEGATPLAFSTDNNGLFTIPNSVLNGNSNLMIHVSFIGYQTVSDTIESGKDYTYQLQPANYSIDEVIVTAQYAPGSQEHSVHKVHVIGREKIEGMAAVTLKDVLTNELNIRISNDNILGSGMSLQGLSGQNVKILIDGVPVIGRLDGEIDLSQINLNDVERIEIVEGPLSVNYGSNALAGTINIITKKESAQKMTVGITTYTENIGTYNFNVNTAFKIKPNQHLRISGGRNYFDGWKPSDDFFPSFDQELADSNRVDQWNAKEQYFGRIQYLYQFKKLQLGFKSEYFKEEITNLGTPRTKATTIVAFDDYYNTKRWDNSLSLDGKVGQNRRINVIAAFNDYRRVKEAYLKDLTTLEQQLIEETATNDLQDTTDYQLLMSRGSITTTHADKWINYELGYDLNFELATGKRIEDNEQQLGDYAIFATAELSPFKDFVIKPGVRYGYNTKYDMPVTPSLNLKYAKGPFTFRGSYAQGFRAPTLKELYFNFDDVNHSLFGNSDLKAEQSDNYSLSISHKKLVQKVLIKSTINLFYNDITNLIDFAQVSTSGDTAIYVNIGKNKTQGATANVSFIRNALKVNLGASYIGRYNDLSDDISVDEFSYSAEFMANASYVFKKPQLTLSTYFKHQGELPSFGYNTDGAIVKQTIESYQLLDATVSKQFFKQRFQVALGVKNIFDVQQVNSTLSSNNAHSGSGSSISVGTGRTLFLKLNLQISKN